MRRSLRLSVLLLTSACSRQLYSAPVPVSAAAAVPLTTAPNRGAAAPPMANVSSEETVNYILARGMMIPVAGVAVNQLRDSFDEGRDASRVHRSLDIMAPRGTPVLSADGGRLLRISASALGGNSIYATDPLGRVVYYYAHLDAYQPGLAQGATVARGDTLGFVGTTGNAQKDAPHLHFQIMRMPSDGKYWDGDAINPYPLFLLTPAAARP